MQKRSYHRKLVEALSVLPESKRSPRFIEAKGKMAAESRNRGKVIRDVMRMREDRELNRLVPNIQNYVLIGQASIARILPNATQVSLATVYVPGYRGDFFWVDSDSVSKKLYSMNSFNDRQQVSFSPPLGGVSLTQPWLIGVIAGAPILSLAQANIIIARRA